MKTELFQWGAAVSALLGASGCYRSEPAFIPLRQSTPPEVALDEPIPPLIAEGPRQKNLPPVAGPGIDMQRFMIVPAEFIGYTVEGTARVGEIISERGFWLIDGPNKVLAVLREDTPGGEQLLDLNPGQLIRFEGIALTPDAAPELAARLSPETKAAIESEPGFIALRRSDVMILEREARPSDR